MVFLIIHKMDRYDIRDLKKSYELFRTILSTSKNKSQFVMFLLCYWYDVTLFTKKKLFFVGVVIKIDKC